MISRILHHGHFAEPLVDGQYRSVGFPGLWLEPAALLAGDLPRVLEVLQAGLASDEHARFVAQFRAAI